MYNQVVTYEKQCGGCKVINGTFLACFGVFQTFRAKLVWPALTTQAKILNVTMSVIIYYSAILQWRHAYFIFQGKKMNLVVMQS